jgi:hypothetical protein
MKQTKQQKIEELERLVSSLDVQYTASQRVLKFAEDKYSDFILTLERMLNHQDYELNEDAVFPHRTGPVNVVSREGIIRRISCMNERETIYRTELEELKVKYHELVRGLAKISEPVRPLHPACDNRAYDKSLL